MKKKTKVLVRYLPQCHCPGNGFCENSTTNSLNCGLILGQSVQLTSLPYIPLRQIIIIFSHLNLPLPNTAFYDVHSRKLCMYFCLSFVFEIFTHLALMTVAIRCEDCEK